ncbi:MAG: tRNA 2-thiouridine(34) synthase MnmA [Clostridia bacterium]|nr:tRNA 2-thiouridine(34) synthase MnmA [Clostridia bacterium]
MQRSVVLGISGGVDSAVAAYLLKQQGYDVKAVFLSMHGFSASSLEDAKKVCDRLNIPLEAIDASAEFEEKIEKYFINEYKNGRTPNPCVRCNAEIKFELLKRYADENGIENIASGHYCKVSFDGSRYYIEQTESSKDQAYMLARLSQDILSRMIFPLTAMEKDDVRKIAKEAEIPVASKPDSQEICFIPDNDYVSFIESREGKCPQGDFYLEDEDKIIGKHKGIIHYTTGQRKGLGIAYGVPLTVKRIDAASNTVTVTKSPELRVSSVKVANICYQKLENAQKSLDCFVKLRYSAKKIKCKVEKLNNENELLCTVYEAAKFASNGQTAVFYDENGAVLFGGEISEVNYA